LFKPSAVGLPFGNVAFATFDLSAIVAFPTSD